MDSPPRTPSPQPIPPQAQLPMRTVVRRRAGARVAGKTLPHTPHPQLLAAMNAGSPCEGRATRLARELDFQEAMLNLPGVAEELNEDSLVGWDHSLSEQMQELPSFSNDDQLFNQFVHSENSADVGDLKGKGRLDVVEIEGLPPRMSTPRREDGVEPGESEAAQLHVEAPPSEKDLGDHPRKRQRMDSPTNEEIADQCAREGAGPAQGVAAAPLLGQATVDQRAVRGDAPRDVAQSSAPETGGMADCPPPYPPQPHPKTEKDLVLEILLRNAAQQYRQSLEAVIGTLPNQPLAMNPLVAQLLGEEGMAALMNFQYPQQSTHQATQTRPPPPLRVVSAAGTPRTSSWPSGSAQTAPVPVRPAPSRLARSMARAVAPRQPRVPLPQFAAPLLPPAEVRGSVAENQAFPAAQIYAPQPSKHHPPGLEASLWSTSNAAPATTGGASYPPSPVASSSRTTSSSNPWHQKFSVLRSLQNSRLGTRLTSSAAAAPAVKDSRAQHAVQDLRPFTFTMSTQQRGNAAAGPSGQAAMDVDSGAYGINAAPQPLLDGNRGGMGAGVWNGDADVLSTQPQEETGPVDESVPIWEERRREIESLGLMPVPLDGFPMVHPRDIEDRLRHIKPATLARWRSKPANTRAIADVLCQDHIGDAKACKTHDALERVIKVISGLPRVVIDPPPRTPAGVQKWEAPTAWLLSNLPPRVVYFLVLYRVFSLDDITFIVYEDREAPPLFLAPLAGLTQWDEEAIRQTIIEEFRKNPTFTSIKKLVAANQDYRNYEDKTRAALDIIETVEVTVREVVTKAKTSMAAYVYMDAPTRSPQLWKEWRDGLAVHTFPNLPGRAAVSRRLTRCEICHGADHQTGQCEFPHLDGWKGVFRRRTPGRSAGGHDSDDDYGNFPGPSTSTGTTRGRDDGKRKAPASGFASGTRL
ncbi:hypothetical protein VTO73DRAFT_4354 [Trametes versicolor]